MSEIITVDGTVYSIDGSEVLEALSDSERLAARLNALDGVKIDTAGEDTVFIWVESSHNRRVTRAIHDECFVVLDIDGYGSDSEQWDHYIYAVREDSVHLR